MEAVTHAVPGLPQEVTVRHTCDHPHRFNELVTKSEEWKGSLRQACVNVRHPPSKAPVDVHAALDTLELREMIE